MKLLALDLFCGLGGWAEGLLAAGWDVAGFDIECHVYGDLKYPAQLVLQDVLTIHGSQFRNAGLIVASPPCQEYSYMAMPWKRGKAIAAALRGQCEFPAGYTGSRTIPELTALFDACFRIQREASEAARRHIPLVVENVKGAQPWVGRAAWNYGSYYLWGDVPALMPVTFAAQKRPGRNFHGPERGESSPSFNGAAHEMRGTKNTGGSWFNIGSPGQRETNRNPVHELARGCGHADQDGHGGCAQCFADRGVKQGGSGAEWWRGPLQELRKAATAMRTGNSRSTSRKAASALIAKIPFALAYHIGQVYLPLRGGDGAMRASQLPGNSG